MKNKIYKKQIGITLLELLIVLSLFSLIIGLTVKWQIVQRKNIDRLNNNLNQKEISDRLLEYLQKDINRALGVSIEYGKFITNNNILILKLPIFDPDGYLTKHVDIKIYWLNEGSMYLIYYPNKPDSDSNRKKQILIKGLNVTPEFYFYDRQNNLLNENFDKAEIIGIKISVNNKPMIIYYEIMGEKH